MAQALRKSTPEPLPYSDRIRELVKIGEILEAQRLLAVALEREGSSEDLSHWQRLLGPARVMRVGGERDIDRTADFQWLKNRSKEYVGQWVALFGGDLLAHADSLQEILRQLESHPSGSQALLHRIY
jgi:hypothetical protein